MRIIGLILLACLAIYALKIAFVLLILAGLIFRTKQTVGLLGFFGVLGLLSKYPVQCLGIAAVAVLISLYVKRNDGEGATELTDQSAS